MIGINNEKMKNAIAMNDIAFFESYRSEYFINYRLIEDDNDTLLLYAISDAKSEIYSYFLNHGADILALNDLGESIVHSIIYSGNIQRLRNVVNLMVFDCKYINLQANDGTSPLLLSVLLEKYDIFEYLLESGADVNIADNENNAPIHVACFQGNKEMVLKLVNKGAKLNTKTKKGNYPIALAINEGHDDIVRFLYKLIYK